MIEGSTRERPARERARLTATKQVEVGCPVGEAPAKAYAARFLELPVPLVLVVLWLVGVVLLGMCGVALYLAATGLAHVFAGV